MAGKGISCPVCSGTCWDPYLVVRDMYTAEPYELVRCASCGLGRTRADLGDLAALYEVAGEQDAGLRFGGPAELLMRGLRRWRVRAIERHWPQFDECGKKLLDFLQARLPGRILDIGCGRAVLLSALAKRGWDVYGTEQTGEIAASARRALGERILVGPLEEIDFGALRFDVISGFHVLEHMPDPRVVLARARELLAPGGRIIIGVPNLDSWQARLFGAHWLHLDVPRHLWHFSDFTLRRMAAELGLAVIAEEHFSFEYGPYGMFQGALARVGLGNELFTRLLRRRGGGLPGGASAFWKHALLAGPIMAVGLASLPAELAAAAAGHGGVITMVFEAVE